tara:strand:- start:335 stop:490 length:156 start_codon:yes stop_codon:yes gene_type:complete
MFAKVAPALGWRISPKTHAGYQQTFQVINKNGNFPWFYLLRWQIPINLFSI